MPITTLLFDVDGTLLDTNRLHVEAWRIAFAGLGHDMSEDRIGEQVGKGGDQLVAALIGMEGEKQEGEALRKAHTDAFKRLVAERGTTVFPGVLELFSELKKRRIEMALATSSKPDELTATQKAAHLSLIDNVDFVVTAEDVENSKPAPDLIMAALKKSASPHHACAMVGDTPFDIQAAHHAGIPCIALTCGGYNDAMKLRQAGANAVYRDPADLLTHLDEALTQTHL